eukprot:Hpha_TRINITY_DN15680_c1_g1::TRINITY_DN15680_c1_g1_i1::g.99886::m.99886/K01193/INV, sacA; beta-fructofuranosidase
MRSRTLLILALLGLYNSVEGTPRWEDLGTCLNGPCYPGNEFCAEPFKNAPAYHLMDQHGCGENDPNGPVFDPVHGVVHHFYQIHLAASPGHGPDYGHFVSKDFVHWAALPVAIWNGLDSSSWPPKKTPYDNEAIFTGSAVVVDGAGPGGKGKGVVNIYPGLCNKNDWPGCQTGTLLAQAVPADYAGDELLTNWTKPSYNPIMENTQRDPSTPWKTPSGEWRLRTYNSIVYGAASDADMLAGKWYEIGTSKDFRTCECPSFYPLPASTPGFEEAYNAAAGSLPSHVHKTSCGGDWWQLGTYKAGAPKELGSFNATPGWEDLFAQKRIDYGRFYASKDNEYPTLEGETRRINWGWAQVPPASTQTLPREITFNAAARALQQYPIKELESLRGKAVFEGTSVIQAGQTTNLKIPKNVTRQSEIVASFTLPSKATTFSLLVGSGGASYTPVTRMMEKTDLGGGDFNITHHAPGTDATVCQKLCDADAKCQAWTYVIRGEPAGSGDCCLKSKVPCPASNTICTSGAKKAANLTCGSGSNVACSVDYTPPAAGEDYADVPVDCGGVKDTLRILASEKTLEIRVFSDWTFLEVFFQRGRVAITVDAALADDADYAIESSQSLSASATVYPIGGIWVTPDEVRKAPRVYK